LKSKHQLENVEWPDESDDAAGSMESTNKSLYQGVQQLVRLMSGPLRLERTDPHLLTGEPGDS